MKKNNNEEIDKLQFTQQAIINVDATPDESYPLRILQAYRENCNVKFCTGTDGSCDNPLLIEMNKAQDKRAEILDRAIQKLLLCKGNLVGKPKLVTFSQPEEDDE